MSDSYWPHRLYPTQLLCPWNFPGKNPGVGCHFLLQGVSQPRHRTFISCSCLAGRFFTTESPGNTLCMQTFYESINEEQSLQQKSVDTNCTRRRRTCSMWIPGNKNAKTYTYNFSPEHHGMNGIENTAARIISQKRLLRCLAPVEWRALVWGTGRVPQSPNRQTLFQHSPATGDAAEQCCMDVSVLELGLSLKIYLTLFKILY